MEQRARQAEQTAFSKNAEVQAAQSKLNSLKAEFERATENLLAEQRFTLEAGAKSLRVIVRKQKKLLADTEELTKEAELELSTVRADIVLAQDDLRIARRAVENEQNNLVETRKQQEQATVALETTKSEAIGLEQSVSRLTTEESELLESISAKKDTLYTLEQQEMNANDAFLAAEALRKKKLQELGAKLLVVTQEIEQKQAEDDATRQSLAEWQKRLQAQDQNLRIREAKVEEGETKIVRNSTLLNL